MSRPLSPDAFDALHDFVNVRVAGGFAPLDEIVEEAVDAFAEDSPERTALQQVARRLVERAALEHAAAQRHWPAVTDCDRLDAAFADLEAAGILARQHFSCCGTCGDTEIRDEMQRAIKGGHTVRGFTFFHVQDTDHAVDGEGIYLSYGSVDEDRAAAVAIGHEVLAALAGRGLQPAWNGKLAFRILLPLSWQRRRDAGAGSLT
jgi:hypothetical protein